MDPLFKERFGISTPIEYLWDVKIEPKWKPDFEKKWKIFTKRKKALSSERRYRQFERFLMKLEQEGDDLSMSSRVEIRHISKKVGHGVFARVDIAPYTLLNQYGGVLRPDKLIQSDSDSVFMFSLFLKYSIDAGSKGNWTRFMNHSTKKASALGEKINVVAWEHYSFGSDLSGCKSAGFGPRIIFTAGYRGIKKGSQLLYDYGDAYWENGEGVVEF